MDYNKTKKTENGSKLSHRRGKPPPWSGGLKQNLCGGGQVRQELSNPGRNLPLRSQRKGLLNQIKFLEGQPAPISRTLRSEQLLATWLGFLRFQCWTRTPLTFGWRTSVTLWMHRGWVQFLSLRTAEQKLTSQLGPAWRLMASTVGRWNSRGPMFGGHSTESRVFLQGLGAVNSQTLRASLGRCSTRFKRGRRGWRPA